MEIICKAMGSYQTNCYILTINNREFIIDPGVGAINWLKENTKNPVAILNTHGHFDHVWSNSIVKSELNIPIYAPKDDEFLLANDQHGFNMPPSKADYWVKPNETVEIDGVKFTFNHYAGHTPGTSTIEIEDRMFSGDFIFQNSIGRCDFPYSNPKDMKESLKRFLKRDDDKIIYPGHGGFTHISKERENLKVWLDYI